MKEDVILSDRKRFDILINRTRLVVLGRETSQSMHQGERIHTVKGHENSLVIILMGRL